MARAFRQFSVFADEDHGAPLVRIRVTAKRDHTVSSLQRSSSTGSPRFAGIRSNPVTPTAVGFASGDSDPMGFCGSPGSYSASPSRLDKMHSTGSLSSAPGSADMEQDVLAALMHINSALETAKSQPVAPSAKAGKATASPSNHRASKKRSSFRRAAVSRISAEQ
jgi:hypothetical protein